MACSTTSSPSVAHALSGRRRDFRGLSDLAGTVTFALEICMILASPNDHSRPVYAISKLWLHNDIQTGPDHLIYLACWTIGVDHSFNQRRRESCLQPIR